MADPAELIDRLVLACRVPGRNYDPERDALLAALTPPPTADAVALVDALIKVAREIESTRGLEQGFGPHHTDAARLRHAREVGGGLLSQLLHWQAPAKVAAE